MNITDLKASLDYLARAEITPFIWGQSGVGKTSTVKQWAEEKGFKFFAFYLGTQSDTGDILGLYDFVKNSEGKSVSVDYAIPQWLHDTIVYCQTNPTSGAVIFLDEFNRGRKEIMQGMFSFALDKKFHTIQLPKNCHIIAAGNPPTDEYFTTDVDDTALMARFVHIKLEPSVEEWVNYAKMKQFESSLVGFIQDQPELLSDKRSEFTLPIKVDNRSYERLSKLFKVNTPKHLLDQLMQGIIGLERTVAYQQYLVNSEKPLTGEEVMNKDKWHLLEKWCDPSNVMASCLNITCDNLIHTLKDRTEDIPKDQGENLMAFLRLVPKDISFKFFDKIVMELVGPELNHPFRRLYIDSPYSKELLVMIRTARGKN